MTKATMIRNYRKFSAADSYIVGFVYNGLLYFAEMAEIAPRFLKVEQASRNQGDNLRLRIRKELKESLMRKNPVCLGSAEILDGGKYNKGENFEKAVTEYFSQEWEKDRVPFNVSGDITLNGKEIQIKLDSATLVNEKYLNKLKKG